MKQNYLDMSINDFKIIIDKKDKQILDMKNKISKMNDTIRIIGFQNRKLKRNNERYQERLSQLLDKRNVKSCSTCKNNNDATLHHTCSVCVESEEDYLMWEVKE